MFSFFLRKKIDPVARLKAALGEYVLPSFPGAVMEALQKIRNPESSASDVAKTLALDPGLSVRVLRIANSAAFSPLKKVENLSQAVALVGLSQLESIVLSAAVSASIPRVESEGFDYRQFWRASVRRGIMARSLAQLVNPTRVSEAFTAGFLQDLALPFLVAQRPTEYGPVLKEWRDTGRSLDELERAVFDWDHAEVATWICHEWDLPENIASAIGGHHKPNDDEYDCPPSVSLVAYLGEAEDELWVEALVERAESRYSIPREDARKIVESSVAAAEDLAQMI